MALILTGCVVKQQQPAPVEPTQPVEPVQPVPQPEPVPQPQPVPQPPKLVTINWDASVQPLVAQMLQAASAEPGSVLLVDRIKNSTNGALQSEKATAAIQNALNNNGIASVSRLSPKRLSVCPRIQAEGMDLSQALDLEALFKDLVNGFM